MKDCSLVGYTGFVGKSLLETKFLNFTKFFNSQNIDEISKYAHELIVCAAPSAEKWRVNKEPKVDYLSIEKLVGCLDSVKNKEDIEFFLFSTIDVYGDENNCVDEFEVPERTDNHYGYHRLLLENYVSLSFPRAHIIRLPGLFGKNLKKNIIFDLLNDNLNCEVKLWDQYQWFPIDRIPEIMKFAREYEIKLLNLATHPISNAELLQLFDKHVLFSNSGFNKYDIRSIFFENGYYLQKQEVLSELRKFIHGYGNI